MAKPENFIATLTQVANLALSKLGESTAVLLADLETDAGEVADKVRQFIYLAIREAQGEFRWEELTVRTVLAVPADDLAESTLYAWGYRYALPDDYLQPVWDDTHDHEIEGGYLYCDVPADYPFAYVKYSEDPAEWSGHLLKVVYYKLALELCLPVTENADKYAALLNEYERVVLPRAHRLSSYGKKVPNRRFKRGEWGRTRGRRR